MIWQAVSNRSSVPPKRRSASVSHCWPSGTARLAATATCGWASSPVNGSKRNDTGRLMPSAPSAVSTPVHAAPAVIAVSAAKRASRPPGCSRSPTGRPRTCWADGPNSFAAAGLQELIRPSGRIVNVATNSRSGVPRSAAAGAPPAAALDSCATRVPISTTPQTARSCHAPAGPAGPVLHQSAHPRFGRSYGIRFQGTAGR